MLPADLSGLLRRWGLCARDVAKGYERVKPSAERAGGLVSTDMKLHE